MLADRLWYIDVQKVLVCSLVYEKRLDLEDYVSASRSKELHRAAAIFQHYKALSTRQHHHRRVGTPAREHDSSKLAASVIATNHIPTKRTHEHTRYTGYSRM